MLKRIINLFNKDNKEIIYYLFLLPYIFILLYYIRWGASFFIFILFLTPIFLYSLWEIKPKFNDKVWLLFSKIYLLVIYVQLSYNIVYSNLPVQGSFFLIWFLYFLSLILYIERVYLIYYFLYRKFYTFIRYFINIFNFIYIKLLTALIPTLLFLFSIYLFNNRKFFNISDNIYFEKITKYLLDNFFSKFNHLFFEKLLIILIFVIVSLILIKYLDKILKFAIKLLLNLSTFLFLTFLVALLTIIYKHKWVASGVSLPIMLLFSSAYLFILYLPLILLKQFISISWEWKNNIYKKLYNKIYGKSLKIRPFSVIKNTNSNSFSKFFSDLGIFLNKYISYEYRNKNYLNIKDDLPISLWDKDLFWVWRFTESIFQIIDWYSFEKSYKWSFSIGLVWEWWWWKTSVINLLKEEFLDGYPSYKVYDFNPWNYEKKDLIEKFFTDLDRIIWNKKVSKLLRSYLSSLWELHKWFKFLDRILWNNSLGSIKDELNEELSKLNSTKIIIIVDDLDRCDPREILTILNIIKNLWSLTNIIYLVSYDKENIIRVLRKKWFSSSYLDKIINFERFLPINDENKLRKYFFDWFSDIINDIFSKREEMENARKPIIESINSFNQLSKSIFDNNRKVFSYLEALMGHIKFKEKILNSPSIKNDKIKAKDKQKVNKYKKVNKQDLLDFLGLKLSNLFQNVNLRLLKKLLNHLNIIFTTNMYTVWELDKVFIFKNEDYLNIIIINYIKLTDYKWFLDVTKYWFNNFWWGKAKGRVSYDEKNIPEIFQRFYYWDEDSFKKKFLEIFFDIRFMEEPKKDFHNPAIHTKHKIGIQVYPKNMNKNLKIILERFN